MKEKIMELICGAIILIMLSAIMILSFGIPVGLIFVGMMLLLLGGLALCEYINKRRKP
jgi:hypothetical protein